MFHFTSLHRELCFSCVRSFSARTPTFSLKHLIKPFIIKFHPDRQFQQGLNKASQKINLTAIQNLNSYMDDVNEFIRTRNDPGTSHSNEKKSIEIEFVMAKNRKEDGATIISQPGKKNQSQYFATRRKLELRFPPLTLTPYSVENYVARQLRQLLRVSDLPLPTLYIEEENDIIDNNSYYDDDSRTSMEHDIDKNERPKRHQHRKMTAWEASRERFWKRHNRRFDAKKFNQVYRELLEQAEFHMYNKNWIRNNPRLRRKLLANVLHRIEFKESILAVERLVAYRRLLRFLDDNFDDLQLEDLGKYYEEQFSFLVSDAKPFDLSSSAMRKRFKKKEESKDTAYCFTFHHDNQVTLSIPADFENNELKEVLQRNISDFVRTQDSGLTFDYYSSLYR